MADRARKQRPSATLTEDDIALIGEALRIASSELEMSVLTLARVWPSSPLVERMNVYAERMNALRVLIS